MIKLFGYKKSLIAKSIAFLLLVLCLQTYSLSVCRSVRRRHRNVFVNSSILLYLIGAVALTSGFTSGVGLIWLDNVNCAGTELGLINCPASSIGQHNCDHTEDAGVSCQATPCTQGSLRLQGATSGRLEICYNNAWGTVCSRLWNNVDARVACRELGLPSTS